jgi:hypothetical protein
VIRSFNSAQALFAHVKPVDRPANGSLNVYDRCRDRFSLQSVHYYIIWCDFSVLRDTFLGSLRCGMVCVVVGLGCCRIDISERRKSTFLVTTLCNRWLVALCSLQEDTSVFEVSHNTVHDRFSWKSYDG